MKENEYVRATNRVKVSLALACLRDVLPGDNYGVTASELADVARSLRQIETRLIGIIEIEEEK